MSTARIVEGQPGVDHPDFQQTLPEGVAKALSMPVEEVTPPQNQPLKMEGLGGVAEQVHSEEGLVGDVKETATPKWFRPETTRFTKSRNILSIFRKRQEKEEALIEEPKAA